MFTFRNADNRYPAYVSPLSISHSVGFARLLDANINKYLKCKCFVEIKLINYNKIDNMKFIGYVPFKLRQPKRGSHIDIKFEGGAECYCVFTGLIKDIDLMFIPTHWKPLFYIPNYWNKLK